jgi:hypothetical protein
MLGVCQGEDTIICSIDKDLRTIPGKHYNLDSGVVDEVTRHDAWHNFWSQVLTGDSTDNIEGLKGCGKVGTAQCVGEVDYEIPVDTYAQMLQRKVTALYCEVMGEKEGRERLREILDSARDGQHRGVGQWRRLSPRASTAVPSSTT